VPVPPPSGNYDVYPGCPEPATSFAREIYIDPVAGSDAGTGTVGAPFKTLSTALTTKKILPGDRVILLPGNHGRAYIYGPGYLVFANPAVWTWFDFRDGAIASEIVFRQTGKILITNAEVTSQLPKNGNMVDLTSVKDMVFADSLVYIVKNSSSWGASEWLNASNGFIAADPYCLSILDSEFRNTRHTMNVYSTMPNYPGHSIRLLIQGNLYKNISGDALRPNGSDVIVRDNDFIDFYLGPAHGDLNHDDAIQFFPTGGGLTVNYQNQIIDGNYILEASSANRPFYANVQGIASFNAFTIGMKIINNVVLISGRHGITLAGNRDALIENNTVANPTNNGLATGIRATESRASMGSTPFSGTVKNNVAEMYSWSMTWGAPLPPETIWQNNVIIPAASSTIAFDEFNRSSYDFDLHVLAGGPLDGAGAGAYPVGSGAWGDWVRSFAFGDGQLLAGVAAAFTSFFASLGSFFSWLFSVIFGLFVR